LRKYGLRPKAMRIEERTGRGYVREEIRQLCQRYLSKNDMKITNGED